MFERAKEQPGYPNPAAGARPCLLKASNGVVNDIHFLKLLIREYPPALKMTWGGKTPLMFATRNGNEHVLKVLKECTEAYEDREWGRLFRCCGGSEWLGDIISKERMPLLLCLNRGKGRGERVRGSRE